MKKLFAIAVFGLILSSCVKGVDGMEPEPTPTPEPKPTTRLLRKRLMPTLLKYSELPSVPIRIGVLQLSILLQSQQMLL